MTKVEVEVALFFHLQETRVRAGELDQAPGRPFTLSISNQYGDDEVTHTLQTESREALQSWREALWQLFFDMSKSEGGWVTLWGLRFLVFTKWSVQNGVWQDRGPGPLFPSVLFPQASGSSAVMKS